MHSRTRFTVVLVLGMLLPGALAGQGSVSAGDTIRVSPRDGRSAAMGIVQSASPDTLTILDMRSGDVSTYTPQQVDELERSLGRQRHFARRLAITMGVSSAVFGALSAVTWSPCTEEGFMACFLHPSSRGDAFAWGLVGGAVIGLPFGVIFGLQKSHEWETVAFGEDGSGDARVTVQPMVGRQVGLRVSIPLGGR